MLRISWKEFVSNEEVLVKMDVEQTLFERMKKRHLQFLGHVGRFTIDRKT